MLSPKIAWITFWHASTTPSAIKYRLPFVWTIQRATVMCKLSQTMVPPDDCLTVETYHRSHDQNEDLGINDMKTENYEETENK
jgi:hypothetical protein